MKRRQVLSQESHGRLSSSVSSRLSNSPADIKQLLAPARVGVVTWQGEESGQGSSSGLLGLPLSTLLPRYNEIGSEARKVFGAHLI